MPYPRNEAKRKFKNRTVNKLGGTDALANFTHGEFDIRFAGSTNFKLTPNQLSNKEWFLGELHNDPERAVLGFVDNKFSSGSIPTRMEWVVMNLYSTTI